MPRRKKKGIEPASRGLLATDLARRESPADVAELEGEIERRGAVLRSFRDPLGGKWQILAALPIEKVAPTPFQRDVSPAHAKRLEAVIDRLDRFLDPIIAVRTPEGSYWTPNGHHRLTALRALGAKAVTALVLPDPELAYKILALNTEKAHNLREKALETVRMERDLAERYPRPRSRTTRWSRGARVLTLGLCYEERAFLRRGVSPPSKKWTSLRPPLPKAMSGGESAPRKSGARQRRDGCRCRPERARAPEPYLRAFVVARVNPLRFHKGPAPSFDATISKMLTSARNFKAGSIKMEQLARTGGAPEE